MHDHKRSGENILDNIIETIADAVPKQKSGGFFNEGSSVSDKLNSKLNKQFRRQKSVHHMLGGGKSADVFLWRDKKISSSVLVGATLVWVFFEWLDYHFLTIICFALVIGMVVQFVWSNASGIINRSASEVPRLVLPNEYFVNAAVSVGAQVNMFLAFIQDVACGRDIKMFAMETAAVDFAVKGCPWLVGSCCHWKLVQLSYRPLHWFCCCANCACAV